MYAYILEIGGGFFKGVCAPSNATAHFRDPPPRFVNRLWRYALALLRQSEFLLAANTGFREDFFSPTLGINAFRVVCDHTLGIRLGITLRTSKA
jgi:hypothetical protein